jgi:enolase-phosphatase E1
MFFIVYFQDTLFPYVTKNCESYLTDNWDNEDTKKAVQALVDLSKKDVADEVDEATVIKESEDKAEFIAALFKNVQWQMSKDRKSTELKQLQGLIWKKAYADKSVKGQ